MFNDTTRYVDDIITIDNPEFEKHIPDLYPTGLRLNKANTSELIEKVPRVIQGEKSRKDTANSGKLVSD